MGNAAEPHLGNIPEILRPAVSLWFERLADRDRYLSDDLLASVARVVACSEFAGNAILRELDWFADNAAAFFEPADNDEIKAFVARIAATDEDASSVQSHIRRFRHRSLLRILWREVHAQATLDETLGQLSLLADRLLDAASRYAARQLAPRFGQVRNAGGDVVPLVILGMGKLGGKELNFSSDIDLIFCFSEDGQTDGRRTLSAQEYFSRLSRDIIALIDEPTADGFAFRIDTRLRPFGDSGPPVVSFAALESYLVQHGRDWERYAYIKARVVGPQPGQAVVHDLDANLIRPFVYRRYLDYGVFESLREMQSMIAAEVRRRDLADNIKLGPGGIREAEFIVQALQLVRGGSETTLQSRELQEVLPKLVSDRGLKADGADRIRAAYRYLRRAENFIQAIRDQQTHELPTTDLDRARLCLAMRINDWAALCAELETHRGAIAAEFAAIAFRGQGEKKPAQHGYAELWESGADEKHWAELFRERATDSGDELARSIVAFAKSSGTRQIDSIARGRLDRFIPTLIELVVPTTSPVIALTRTLSITEQILRRSAYLALLNENHAALSRLVDLCERSQYISEQIARYPVLLDELLDPRIYSEQVRKEDIARDLRQRLVGVPTGDLEARMRAIALFQRATLFRIAVADFNDKLSIMKVSDGLTWLAEVVLDEALRVAWADMVARHGVPHYEVDGCVHEAAFGIIGYGKLGGLELSYGSDLDIVFLHDSKGSKQVSDGNKPLDNTVFFGRLVRKLVHFLTTQTGSGELYEVDTRLRPDGRSGLLVTSTEAFERYQEENAWTWEHQALLRARAVAGGRSVCREFERIRQETLTQRVNQEKLRADVISMRRKMRKELDRSSKSAFDLKHGRGGIGDIEFLVQYLVLRGAEQHPKEIEFSDNIRQLEALVAASDIDPVSGARLQRIYRHYRLALHHLVLDGKPPLCAVGRFSEERDAVAQIWERWLGDNT